jgi:hypothetical protein
MVTQKRPKKLLESSGVKTMTKEILASVAAELETARLNLMLANDTEGLANILSDELHYAHSNGIQDNKKTFLEKVGNGTLVYRRLDNSPGQAIPLGQNAFCVHGAVSMDVIVSGVERQINFLFLAVWRIERDVWRLVAQQSTLAPQREPNSIAR